jgi:N-methylhydantoinase B
VRRGFWLRSARRGAAFINVVILGAGGGPGTPVTDGWLTIACMGNAGMPFYDSVELDELHCPLIVHARRMRRDSEGAGMFRGAPGAEIEYGPVDCAVGVGFACDGVVNPAQGVRGGGPGALAEAYTANVRRLGLLFRRSRHARIWSIEHLHAA